jgi:hypothetical protein
MSSIDDLLGQVESLNASVKPTEAEDRLRSLLATMGPAELRVWEPDLRRTIERFLPKRRRALMSLLDKLLEVKPEFTKPPDSRASDMRPIVSGLESELEELSAHHIFQWSTFYRDSLGQFFTRFVEASASPGLRSEAEAVRSLLREHTHDTFMKGYFHVTRFDSDQHAIAKSVSGLQRFLDLPIEFYSARLSADLRKVDAIALRNLSSAMLCGIIEGYAGLRFERLSGNQVLSEYVRSWAHVLAFMTAQHVQAVLDVLEVNEFSQSAKLAILPLASALDRLADYATDTDYIPLPALSQLVWPQRRLDVSLRPAPYAPRPVQVQCYLDPSFVDEPELTEAANRELGAIVAPLRPTLRKFVAEDVRVNQIVVPILEDVANENATSDRLITVLEQAIYRRHSTRIGSQSLQYNFAREFPLKNPFLTRYYHVYRKSVRDLLRTFERRNGVRLWCSVRRSGKTTAGIDLGSTTGESNVISQTCDSTDQVAGGSLLYDAICESLARADQLPNGFFQQTVNSCMTSGETPEHRTVLVLDEYETLFGQLSTAVDHDLRLRYTVVQPLLNQMVAFTRDNLIVFLGQQPNAHYILMDQNQLSAYVQQDTFPLFTHDPDGGEEEFSELLQKILSDRVRFDRSFVDRVYIETSGHPYLTANLMVEFVEWLIRTKRPTNALSFTASDVSAFATRMLRRDRISICTEYAFFRDAAIRQALSMQGKRQNPWLYAIYSVIRAIAIQNPESFVCSREEFVDIVARLDIERAGITPDYLLTTGEQSNFLSYSEKSVAPRIRLLGRIAAVATPEVNP